MRVKIKLKMLLKQKVKWLLVGYDALLNLLICLLFLAWYGTSFKITFGIAAAFTGICLAVTFIFRYLHGIYGIVWRYGGVQAYIRFVRADAAAFILMFAVTELSGTLLPGILVFAIFTGNLLLALVMRMIYRYIYKYVGNKTSIDKFLRLILYVFSFGGCKLSENNNEANKIHTAIYGAGQIGVNLAEEIQQNVSCPYSVRCFVDIDTQKIGKLINDIPVYSTTDADDGLLRKNEIQEIIFAIPNAPKGKLDELNKKYRALGYRTAIYDYPKLQGADNVRRIIRDFTIEDLLFRKQVTVQTETAVNYYKGKTVLVTGGGGSIGSELCRQLAKLEAKRIIIVDIYENCAYDVQQELKIAYGSRVDIGVVIASYTNRRALERVFNEYRPQVVINAAAHKHVPLMETNCIEAVENNIFGTLNTVELSEKYGAEHFIQVSTDKAVNPTNVMGATKRVCEFIIQAHSLLNTDTVFSATRFGNVLGSAWSVVPLFKRQIAAGGPVTITDKRITRYFMTIPEAASLVLESGAMAKNGELFVLDMGKPIKIYDLALKMIKLSGLVPGRDIKTIETGLRPGEKLYEELLIKKYNTQKTDNDTIYIEKEAPISMSELEEKLAVLNAAVETDIEENVKKALETVVPTYRRV